MDLYLALVIAFLILNDVLDLVSRALNRRALQPTLPAEFAGRMDAGACERAKAYNLEGSRFQDVHSTIFLVAIVAFLVLGGFPLADRLARHCGWGTVWTGLIFLGLCVLPMLALELPFDAWKAFRLEQKYGFNRTTWRTFMLDRLKGLLLGGAIGGALAGMVIGFFSALGPHAWLYAWAAVTACQIAVQFLAPVLILPLFNTYTPLPEGELKAALDVYLRNQRFTTRGLFTMDGSRRSSRGNAFFTGFGRYRRIVLFDTLIAKHTVPEIVAVVAHEMGHYRRHHVPMGVGLSVATTGVTFALLPFFLGSERLAAAFGMSHTTVYAGLVFFSLLFTPVSRLLATASNALSRRWEFQADAYAVQTTGNPAAMIDALKTLHTDNFAHLTPHPLHVFLNCSHPPVLERIRAIR